MKKLPLAIIATLLVSFSLNSFNINTVSAQSLCQGQGIDATNAEELKEYGVNLNKIMMIATRVKDDKAMVAKIEALVKPILTNISTLKCSIAEIKQISAEVEKISHEVSIDDETLAPATPATPTAPINNKPTNDHSVLIDGEDNAEAELIDALKAEAERIEKERIAAEKALQEAAQKAAEEEAKKLAEEEMKKALEEEMRKQAEVEQARQDEWNKLAVIETAKGDSVKAEALPVGHIELKGESVKAQPLPALAIETKTAEIKKSQIQAPNTGVKTQNPFSTLVGLFPILSAATFAFIRKK